MAADPFYARLAPAVQAATRGTPLFPSVVLAQLALESNYGRSVLAAKYHNYLGHKASARWQGATVRLATPHDAQKVSTFRVYPTLADCLASHVVLLLSPAYRAAQQAPSAYAQAAALAHTYAEDPAYAAKLTALVRANGLAQYDGPAGGPLWALALLAAGAAAYRFRARLQQAFF